MERNDRVVSDIEGGARKLMRHLLSLGHRRIGFVNGVARSILTEERQSVYRESLVEAGIRLNEELVVNVGPTMQDGYEATSALLSLADPPTAIWTINDYLAVGALRAIHDAGLRVPEDVALAGCDGTALSAQLSPPLTTIAIPAEEEGRHAARMLLARFEEAVADPMFEMLPTQLLVRRSTDPSVLLPDPLQPKGGHQPYNHLSVGSTVS
jgi:DNA-binding LacI/PurR family transcriptional regulator